MADSVSVSRWVEGVEPSTPLGEAGRSVLAQRAPAIPKLLNVAARGGEDRVRDVHQLRVTTRRTSSALDVLEDLLPQGRLKAIRKDLKTVRKAANEARDLDVLRLRWEGLAGPEPDVGWEQLFEELFRRRAEAQEPLRKARKLMKRAELKTRLGRLIEKTRWRGDEPEPSFAAAAYERLPGFVDDVKEAQPDESADLEAWHQLRITGKRLRYAMELFAPAFGDEFRDELYPKVQELQDRLGALNDHVTARKKLQAWRDEVTCPAARDRLEELIEQERRQSAEAWHEIRQWWSDQRRAEFFSAFERLFAGRPISDEPEGTRPDEPAQRGLLAGLASLTPRVL